MTEQTSIFAPPFIVIVVFGLSAFIGIGFYRGKKKNRHIYLSTFSELLELFKPEDQTFTNIGGLVGHHASFVLPHNNFAYHIDATITLLPRHAPLYMPISNLLMRSDRLFITFYLRVSPPGEGHLIEKSYDGFRGHEITNVKILEREEISWGGLPFFLYYDRITIRDPMKQFTRLHPQPGTVKHIAVLPGEKKGFVFMIPDAGAVKRDLEPAFRWMRDAFAT